MITILSVSTYSFCLTHCLTLIPGTMTSGLHVARTSHLTWRQPAPSQVWVKVVAALDQSGLQDLAIRSMKTLTPTH